MIKKKDFYRIKNEILIFIKNIYLINPSILSKTNNKGRIVRCIALLSIRA